MTELWLKFETADGEPKRVRVDREEFIIGRHSGCDLSIPNGSLSRQHAKINTFSEVFVVSDCGSSFGTRLNGEELSEPAGLKNGDVLDLAGAVEIGVEFVSDQEEDNAEDEDSAAAAGGGSVNTPETTAASAGKSVPTSFFLLVPIFGILILLCVGGGLFFALSGKNGPAGKNNDSVSVDDDSGSSRRKRPTKKDSPTPEDSPEEPQSKPETGPGGTDPATPPPDVPPPPKSSSDLDKARIYSAAFLSRVVAKDPDAFLLDRQLQQVLPTINKFKSSAALAANLAEVKKNSARITAVAAEKGLKPAFLAAATLAKLGNNRGDVAATAEKMAGILQRLQAVIGVESADEATVIVAAYYQGEAGSFEKMQSTLEGLVKNNTQSLSARQIRTIWFLNESGKLKPEEFELALRFIAVGTIMQKPDEFNVRAEAPNLN